jgi:hypothetical protein
MHQVMIKKITKNDNLVNIPGNGFFLKRAAPPAPMNDFINPFVLQPFGDAAKPVGADNQYGHFYQFPLCFFLGYAMLNS